MLIKKRFFFVRHGMTSWNEKELCQGHTDIELCDEGRMQAQRLAEELKVYSFPKIFTSPLKRALETAQIVQQAMPNSSLHLVDDLKERCWGTLEGMSSRQMYVIEEQEERDPLFVAAEGVEPREDLKKRITRGINAILEQADDPLIVSHGCLFLSLCEVMEHPIIRQIPNTTLIECIPTPDGWHLTATLPATTLAPAPHP